MLLVIPFATKMYLLKNIIFHLLKKINTFYSTLKTCKFYMC